VNHTISGIHPRVAKLRTMASFLMVLLSCALLQGGEPDQLLPIDSIYLSSIDDFYENAAMVKDEIWEGMQLAPACLYRVNGPALLYDHPSPPESFIKVSDRLYHGVQKELQLFGATQMEINGVITAIVDYGNDFFSNKEEVLAILFHELHHVYQRRGMKQIKPDDPAVLMVYPENVKNDALKLYEQETLYQLCFENDEKQFQKLLNQFYSCRLEREQIIGDFLEYEKRVENIEGPAFYCEYRYYNQSPSISEALKSNYNEKYFFAPLTTPYYGRNNLRGRHLASGMAMCFILDSYYLHWQKEYYAQDLPLYDFFISRFTPQKEEIEIDPNYYRISEFHTNRAISAHRNSFQNFINQPGVKITLRFKQTPQFRGFDPMHAESINDSTVLHKTFLRLAGRKKDEIFISDNNTATIIDKKIWFVKEVILFAPGDRISTADDRIEIDQEGKKVSWSGTLAVRNEEEMLFLCD